MLAKMTEKQMSLDSFFTGKRTPDEPEEEPKTSKKTKPSFNRQYNESYLKYRFVATGECQAPRPCCIICGQKLANDAMKPSKLLRHMETKHPGIKDKPLEFFERKKHEHEGQRQLVRATTSTNANALKASYLVAKPIAKAKKHITIGEEPMMHATKDVCCKVLGEVTVKKVAQVPLSAGTVIRCIDDLAEDIEEQLLERIKKSPWYANQVDESTDIDNKATVLTYV